MLPLFRSHASSGEPSIASNGWWKRHWLILVAALMVALPIVLAVVLTTITGQLFGVWGWAEVALILLIAVTFGLLTLGAYRGVHNPYRWVMPGADHWGAREPDPQTLYAGSIRPPLAADARTSSDYRPLLIALAPALGALAMLAVIIAGSRGDDGPPQPAALPIIEVEGNVSLMLEEVVLDPGRMTLTFRIDDLQWGSKRRGYEIPQFDDLTLAGASQERPGIVSAEFTPLQGEVKPGINAISTWWMHLYLAPPADSSQPVTVTLHRLRTIPNQDIPDLPETIDGDWLFTFVPADVANGG